METKVALLTERERQVLDLWYTEELSQKQIAAKLDISLRSVEGVFYAIRKKLDCGSHPAGLCKFMAAVGQPAAVPVAA